MKIKLIAVVLLLSSQAFSQSEEIPKFNKHSLGLDFEFLTGNPNIGFTYRKFKEESRYNFRASLFLGGSNNFTFSNQQSDLFYRTNDSVIPFLGVNNSSLNSNSYRRLEIGIESIKEYKKVDLISGVALNIGHITTSSFSSVYQAQEQEVIKNGITYYQLVNLRGVDQQNLNSLTSTIHYLNAGLSFHAGLKLDISSKIYFTTMLNVRANAQWTILERNEYLNDTYIEHLPSKRGASTFNFDTGINAGVHYKF